MALRRCSRPVDLDRLERDRAADAIAVEVGEQLRLGVPRRPELGVAPGRLRERLLPLGRVRERLVRAELDHRAPDVLVVVDDVDERRARPVRLPRQRAHEVSVLDEAVDEHLLPGLDVRADADGELRVALEPVVAHASCHSSSRISGHGRSVGEHRVHLELGPADHEVDVRSGALRPSGGSPSARKGKPAPYAMWQVAFSSNSVS